MTDAQPHSAPHSAPRPVWPHPNPGYPRSLHPRPIGRWHERDGERVYVWESWVIDATTIYLGEKKRRRYPLGPCSDPEAWKAFRVWESIRDELAAGRHPADRQDLGSIPTLAHAANRFLDLEANKPTREEKTYKGVETNIRWMCNLLDPKWETEGPTVPTLHLDGDAIRKLAAEFVTCSGSTQNKRVRDVRRFVQVMTGEGVRFGVPEPKAPNYPGWPREWCVRPAAAERRERGRQDPRSKYLSRGELHRLLGAMRPLHVPGTDLGTLPYHERLAELRRRRTTAYTLLGVNCGMLPSDIGVLRVASIDYRRGVIIEPRSKTGKHRVSALWPETAYAIRLAVEPGIESHPDNPKGLAFLTQPVPVAKGSSETTRGPVYYALPRGQPFNAVSRDFRHFAKALDISKGYGLLRHTHATIGKRSGDDAAVQLSMGHANTTITDDHYIHENDLTRQRVVAAVIRRWLFYIDEPMDTPFRAAWEVGGDGYLGLISPHVSRAIDQAEEDARTGGDIGDDISPLGAFGAE